MKRNKTLFVFLLSISILISGCSSRIPELTEEESALVSEYAAHLLLKYDVNHHSKLIDTSEIPEEELLLMEKETENVVEEQIPEETPTDTTEVITEDTPIIETVQETPKITEVLGLADMSIDYVNYTVEDGYPSSNSEDFFLAFDATEGNQLLVFHFQINNLLDQAQSVNLLEKNINTKIIINQDKVHRTLMTLLIDDFNSYIGDLEPLGSKEIVLIVEVPVDEVEQITSADLQIKYEGTTKKIPLF